MSHNPYLYKCIIKRVVDGDTVYCDVDLGFGNWLFHPSPKKGGVMVRMFGIDAPESRTRDPIEKVFGEYSKKMLTELLPPGTECYLVSKQFTKGKFGRILGDFETIEENMSACKYLLDINCAIEYVPDMSAKDKQINHLGNRIALVKSGQVPLPPAP